MIQYECLYCGETWFMQFEPDYIGCNVCKERKMIKKSLIQTLDIYGYRYSPDFPIKTVDDHINTYGDDYFNVNSYAS